MTQKVTLKKADEWRPIFLGILRETANVRLACEKAGISRKTAYQHRGHSAEFSEAWDTALEEACDLLEGAARQRALVQSDTLLIFLLKAHRPDKYRETVNVNFYVQQEAARVSAATGMPLPEAEAKIRAVLQGVGYGGR